MIIFDDMIDTRVSVADTRDVCTWFMRSKRNASVLTGRRWTSFHDFKQAHPLRGPNNRKLGIRLDV